MKTYQIHLIRHGITDGNLKGQYIGRTDLPLSPAGIEQLEQYKQQFSYPEAQVYFTSPLTRCKETLKILYPDAAGVEIHGFRECNFGAYEEKTAKELAEDPQFTEWMAGGATSAPPGGESGAEFITRTCSTFEKVVDGLLKTGTQSAVIMAHGGTIMAILSCFGLPRAEFYDWVVANGRGYSLRVQPRLWMTDRVLEVYDTIPPMEKAGAHDDEYTKMFNVAREAAKRAYKIKPEEE